MMKRKIGITILGIWLSFQGIAQQDVKLNFSNLLIYELMGSYEYSFNPHISLSGIVGYSYGFPDVNDPTAFFYVGPELRLYVAPKRTTDGFFVGVYSRYKNGYTLGSVSQYGILKANGNYDGIQQGGNIDYEKFSMGIVFGAKWVTDIGFVYGFYLGGGRHLWTNYTFGNFTDYSYLFTEESYEFEYWRGQYDNELWEVRVGFNIGWRF